MSRMTKRILISAISGVVFAAVVLIIVFVINASPPAVTPAPTPKPTPTSTSTPAPTTTTPSPTLTPLPVAIPTPTITPTPTLIELNARNMAFSQGVITVRAGAFVTINFTNYDSGIQHNFALYDNVYDLTPTFSGQPIGGIASIVYRFTAPTVPGTYFFTDDVHRVDMFGQFVVVP